MQYWNPSVPVGFGLWKGHIRTDEVPRSWGVLVWVRLLLVVFSWNAQGDPADCHLNDGKMRAELRRMVVSPHHRRLGIAALLIQTLVAHAREHKMPAVYLGTTQYQQAAIHMYKKFGWVENRRDFYGEGIIKVIQLEYRLDLS
jgi:GNAT superfamily N-acetyltransferase